MNTIQNLFQQAQLAEAAYANFFDTFGNLITSDDGVKATLIATGFSKDPNNLTQSTQATAFVADWGVVDQYTAPDGGAFGTGTGFSATLFQNKTTGQYTFAIRGTEPGIPDAAADLGDIVTDGIAMDQVVDMYNYWHRLQAWKGQPYLAAKLETRVTETLERAIAYGVSDATGREYDAQMATQGYLIDSPTGLVKQIITGLSLFAVKEPCVFGVMAPVGIA